MRKDIQKGIKDAKRRKIYYLSGIGFTAGLLVIAIVAMIYVGTLDNSKDEAFTEIKGLADGTKEGTFVEEASSGIGKSIDEVQNEENNNNTNDNVLVVKTSNETNNKTTSNEPEEIKETKKKQNINKQENKDIVTSNTEIKEEVKASEPVFSMPVEGEIIKEFAKDKLVYSDTLKEWVTHAGIDIKAEKTTIVKASEAGTIKSIKNDPRYGLTVVIEHNMRI